MNAIRPAIPGQCSYCTNEWSEEYQQSPFPFNTLCVPCLRMAHADAMELRGLAERFNERWGYEAEDVATMAATVWTKEWTKE